MTLKQERRFWFHTYKFTWERVQQGSYKHFIEYTRNQSKIIVDIGTGPGTYIPKLCKNNFYIFTDFDIKLLKQARINAKNKLSPNSYRFAVMDASRALGNSFKADVVSSLHVITSIQDQKSFIISALNMLKDSGEFLLYVSEAPIAHKFLCKLARLKVFNIRKTIPSLKYNRIKINSVNYCYIIKRSDNEHILKAS